MRRRWSALVASGVVLAVVLCWPGSAAAAPWVPSIGLAPWIGDFDSGPSIASNLNSRVVVGAGTDGHVRYRDSGGSGWLIGMNHRLRNSGGLNVAGQRSADGLGRGFPMPAHLDPDVVAAARGDNREPLLGMAGGMNVVLGRAVLIQRRTLVERQHLAEHA